MDKEQVDLILDNCRLPGDCRNPVSIETHISWILLSGDFAFKIKRPVKYSFLDFSSRDKRRHYCNRELVLNRRLAEDMYIQVIPVTRGMVTGRVGDKGVIDHAVQMKRMDNSREMDRLLKKNAVSPRDIDRLAEKIAGFHRRALRVDARFEPSDFQEQFADILSSEAFIKKTLGSSYLKKIDDCIKKSAAFIDRHRHYIQERTGQGYRRDCHGDLNARNIFLYRDPVIFDCIEFNDEFRHIDVVNEIAFLCVDMDFFGHPGLAERFYRHYLDAMGMKEDAGSKMLFDYYKSFRANVRAKVTILSAREEAGRVNTDDIRRYIDLMSGYMNHFL